ncbi:uncharacterized protein V1518DRAFT_325054 [Limtongia smithiae]|uniref:uncharacterized protein n=1 Tax=Limtongia smithiae TaxID=1125753 RepID=UPI0034CE4992
MDSSRSTRGAKAAAIPAQTALLLQLVSILEAEDPDSVVLNAKVIPRPDRVLRSPKRTRTSEYPPPGTTAATATPDDLAAATAAAITVVDTVSVLEKFRLGDYSAIVPGDALQTLQDDIKLATQHVLSTTDVGAPLYARVDKFYFYAEMLVARTARSANHDDEVAAEAYALATAAAAEASAATAVAAVAAAATATALPGAVGEDGLPLDEEETDAAASAAVAAASAIEQRGEDKQVLYMVSQHGPLFSSLSRKSRMDPRVFAVPPFFNTTKIVPMVPPTLTARRLGMLSPSPYYSVLGTAAVATAAIKPLLADFVHPVNESLPTAHWIRYSPYSSFAPSRDESHVIVSGTTAARVWYEKTMRRRATLGRTAEATSSAVDLHASSNLDTLDDDTSASSTPAPTCAVSGEVDNSPIDPELIQSRLDEDPGKEYDDAALLAVTQLIERLQTLQCERFSSTPPQPPAPSLAPQAEGATALYSVASTNPPLIMQQLLQKFYLEGGVPPSQEELELARMVEKALAQLASLVPPYLLSDMVSGLVPTLGNCSVGSLPPDSVELPTVPPLTTGGRKVRR